jgi:hypothetical protein
MEYPTDIKHLNREVMEAQNKHLAEDIQPCALGEKTHIEVFEEHNKHLSPAYFAGVKKHLTQDVIFDEFIREQIDCSKKLDDEFEYAYQMKEISFEIYKARERAIEKLEDELELAEEALENKYGIDD